MLLQKLKTELPYDPAIPLLGIHISPGKTMIWKDICTPKFTAVLFIIAKTWKQHKCPSSENMVYICIYRYIYTHIYIWASLVAQTVKSSTTVWKTWVHSQVGKIPRRRAWQPIPVFWPGESPWTEEPGKLQSMGLQRVGHDWATKQSTYTYMCVYT